jgi:hypothetical protein
MNKKQSGSDKGTDKGSGNTSGNTSATDAAEKDNGASTSSLDPRQASVFVIKQQYKRLTNGAFVTDVSATLEGHKKGIPLRTRRISFAELVHCACFPFATKSQKLMHVIKKEVSLYTQYEWILEKVSFASSSEQVAASTASKIMSRTTDYFDFQIKPDNSNVAQVHLLLSLKQAQENDLAYAKGVFLHCILNDEFKVLHFENVLDGQAQIIIEKDSATYHLITSPNTKLYLC